MQQSGERVRGEVRWRRVLECSLWHQWIVNREEQLVGFVRCTSDLALNANLWDLWADARDPAQAELLLALVQGALAKLRRELPGCSISLSAPPEAVEALKRQGFVLDPGGIRAMGLQL